MRDKLIAGNLIDGLNANSMAKDIEDEFIKQWPRAMEGTGLSVRVDNQLRLLFVAVARGVIKHLHRNKDAFEVTVSDGSGFQAWIEEIHTIPEHWPGE